MPRIRLAPMLKYLRIAVTALSLTACVLLIALWVRSYYGMDGRVFGWSYNRSLAVASLCGEVGVVHFPKMNYIGISPNKKLNWEEFPHYPYSSINNTGYPRVTRRQPPFRADFRWCRQRYTWYVGVPYWFLTLSTVAIGAASWIRPSRRFSLRTLLITTALVATVLWIASVAVW
jgi:hypothetical protein